jgi:hypothetical protein
VRALRGTDEFWTARALRGARVLVAASNGRVHSFALENLPLCPPLVTPWCSPLGNTYAFGCTLCRVWSDISGSALDIEIPCPNCGRMVKPNPFVIDADWRPVSAAWGGEEG